MPPQAVPERDYGWFCLSFSSGPVAGGPPGPNISSTRWRTVADQKNRIYYYESVLYPFLIWVDFDELDFTAGAPVGMIDPASGKRYAGNTSAEFSPAEPFVFQAAK